MTPLNENEEAVTPAGRGELRRVGLMLLLVGGLHLPSLFNPFFIDDYVYIDTVHDLGWSGLGDIFTTSTMGAEASSVWWTPSGALPFYRPLGELTFAVDYRLWELNPFGYHLTNLLLHLLCAFLTWRLVRRFCDVPGVAFAAATLFAIHPVHTEAVLWISGRFDLLVCAATIASVLAYLNWQRGGAKGWRWGAASVACYLMGLGCKETALVLPIVIVVGECLRWRGPSRVHLDAPGKVHQDAPYMGRLMVAALAFGALSVVYLAARFAMFGGLGTLPPPYGLDTSSAPAAVKAMLWNLSQYLFDFTLFIQVDAIYLSDFWARHPAIPAILITFSVVIIAICARLAFSTTAFRVGAAWTAVFTAPCLLAMPGERNVYLASVGVAMIAASALGALSGTPGTQAGRLCHTVHWVRWVTKAVLTTCVLLVAVEQATMWVVASTGEKVFRDLLALLPEPPPEARIYVVNQCPLNAVGFEQGLNLRYGREDIRACALSLAPALEGLTRDIAYRTGVNTLRLQRENGHFFQSFVERFHLFSRDSASDLEAAARRLQFQLLDPPATIDGLTALELTLPLSLDDPRLHLFVWNNREVESRADYPRLAELTRLEPIELIDSRQSADAH